MNKRFILKEVRITFRGILHFFNWVRAFQNILKMGEEVSKIGGNLKYNETMYY